MPQAAFLLSRSVRPVQEACLLARLELGRQVAWQALDVIAVGLGAGQSDHPTLRALDRVHGDQQVVAARADVLVLGLHVFGCSIGRARRGLIAGWSSGR